MLLTVDMLTALPHLQFISFSFLLPFGWPDMVIKFASYIAGLVSLDFGCEQIADDKPL